MASNDSMDDMGCQSCGRAMDKAKKIHKGKRYCATCYPRLFKRRMCAGCGNFARLPTFDLAAQCGACERSGPCVRCGRTEFKIGRQSAYGPVCKSCAPHFREPAPCDVCGELSQRLVRNTTTGLRTCPKCISPSASTCPSCRRHRVLVAGQDGIQRCRACTDEGQRSCERCGVAMPAGRGRECESCYWGRTFEKRLAINLKGFSSSQFEELFGRFGQWLLERNGPQKSAMSINRYYSFFRSMEVRWGGIPSYGELLDQFTAVGLRRAETPMRWLSEVQAISVNAELREQHSEERRLQAILTEVGDPWSQQLLKGYLAMLATRMEKGETNLRSIRLAGRAATNMLKTVHLAVGALPTQKALESFWRSSPGQVAALAGFVGYLNNSYKLQLEWRPNDRWLMTAKRDKAERELVALLGEGQQAEDFEVRWIVKGLAYFHSLRRANRKTLTYRPESYQGISGFSIEYGGKTLWVPDAASYKRDSYKGA